MSRDVPIEKIRSNTEFKLRFTSPSIEELASSFRTDGHQSSSILPHANMAMVQLMDTKRGNGEGTQGRGMDQ